MKKLLIVNILVYCLVLGGFAQDAKPPKGSSFKAETLLQGEKLQEAKAEIDKAVAYEIYKAKSKGKPEIAKVNTYYVKAQIYQALAAAPDAADIDALLKESITSYQKVLELKENKETDPLVFGTNQKVQNIYTTYANKGVEYYKAKDYENAMLYFERSSLALPEDTNTYANILNCAFQIKSDEKIVQYSKKLLSLNFEKDYLFQAIAQTAFNNKDYATAADYALQGLQRYPTNKVFVNTLVQSHVDGNTTDKGIQDLEKLMETRSEDAYLAYVLGYINEKNENMDGAAAAYTKSVELDPQNYDANYNLGVIHYNRGVKVNKDILELPQDKLGNYADQAAYDKLRVERDEHLKKALPFIKKSTDLKSDDQDTFQVLYQIYYILGMKAEQQEVKTILDTFDK